MNAQPPDLLTRARTLLRRSPATFALLVSTCLVAFAAGATPIEPSRDDQVIETLPATGSARNDERRLRRELAARPRDARMAVALAARYIEQARESGDPRMAGQALSALQAWPEPASAPAEVLLMQATVQQYLHDFDGAAKLLDGLLARDERQPQAWLTLATIRRVQGRYGESDRACARLERIAPPGAGPYAAACRAENDALRGDFDAARARLQRLLADPRQPAGTRNWLLTSLAELEERAGRAAAADTAYKAALGAQADGYTLIAYADFLIWQHREKEALALLRGHPRTDAVLLRLAVAGARAGAPDAARDAREMRERIVQSNERPQAQTLHAREQAMFALWVDRDPQRALALARTNVGLQREPIDLLVLAQAAKATGQPQVLAEAARVRADTGLVDRRFDALR